MTDRIELKLKLAPGPGEALRGQKVQDELRAFESRLSEGGLEVASAKRIGGFGPSGSMALLTQLLTGEFGTVAAISTPFAGVVGTALVAWIKGHFGRKVRVEFHSHGSVKKIEARTPEEIAAVLQEVSKGIPTKETAPKSPKKSIRKTTPARKPASRVRGSDSKPK